MKRDATTGRRRLISATRRHLVLEIAALTIAVGVAAGISADWISHGKGHPCQATFVPAYFYDSSIWAKAASSSPVPGYMILDISGVGAGRSPDPHFQAVVKEAQAAHITILGYSSTANGTRPVSAVEADVRNYKAWYHVTSILLDVVSGTASELPYYRELARYVHRLTPGSAVWLNPGTYPDERYMAIGNVIIVFEGPYANYRNISVPSWVRHFPPTRYANTIYRTSASQLAATIRLSRDRRAGYIFVTDGSGSNPYSALPSYWGKETASVASGCPAGSGGSSQ